MTGRRAPVPFEVYEPGVYLHGTKADLAAGDLLSAGRTSNFESGRTMNHVSFTETLDAAAWGAELAVGDGPGPHRRLIRPDEAVDDALLNVDRRR